MDFEGEFNLHAHGEHLCLIQLFDRQEFFIMIRSRWRGCVTALLEEPSTEKIMFDSASDAALAASNTTSRSPLCTMFV